MSQATELRDHHVFDGQIPCKHTGNNQRSERLSARDIFGLTDKKIWPAWPWGDKDKLLFDAGSIKRALMGGKAPVPSAPSRPVRSYEPQATFVTSPRPAELPGDSTLARNQAPVAHPSKSSNGRSITPPIPAKSPNRDLKVHGKDATGLNSSKAKPLEVKKSLDDATQPRLSNYDAHVSTQSSELHGAVATPSTPTTAWPHGNNQQSLLPAVPLIPKDLIATTPTGWTEPPSRFSISTPSTNSTSRNTDSSNAEHAPLNWVEPASGPGTGNRDRSHDAASTARNEVKDPRTIAQRDNALAILEGRGAAHATGGLSGIFGQDKEQQSHQKAKSTKERSEARQHELQTRFPLVKAPVPGTVNKDTHDVSYTSVEGGPTFEWI